MPRMAAESSLFFGFIAAELIGEGHAEHLAGEPEDAGKREGGECSKAPDVGGRLCRHEGA